MEDLDYDYPHSYVEREKLEESSNLLSPKELIEPVKKKLDESPAKRRYTRCRDILQDVERNRGPLGSFREQKRLEIYSRCVALISHISNLEPNTYEEDTKKY